MKNIMQRRGISYLAGGMYSDVIERHHPEGFGAKFFLQKNLFPEDPFSVIRKLCASELVPFVALNLTWDDSHAYPWERFKNAVEREAERAYELALKYPHIEFYVAPVTEHWLTDKRAIRRYLDIVPDLPNVTKVNSVDGPGIALKRFVNEHHKTERRPFRGRFVFDYDGSNMLDSDIARDRRRFRNAEVVWAWHPNCNGIRNLSKDEPRPPRDQREHYLTPEGLKALHAALVMPVDKQAWTAPNVLYKSASDRTVAPDFRSLRPVVICPQRVERLRIVNEETRESWESKPRMEYKDGRFRYYFGRMGYEYGEAMHEIFAGDERIALVYPAFRAGAFR